MTDLVVRHGADFRDELPLLDAEGAPRKLVGWTVDLVIRARHGSPPVYEAVVGHRPGTAKVEIPGAVTREWTFGVGRYELMLIGPKGQVDMAHSGRVLVDRR